MPADTIYTGILVQAVLSILVYLRFGRDHGETFGRNLGLSPRKQTFPRQESSSLFVVGVEQWEWAGGACKHTGRVILKPTSVFFKCSSVHDQTRQTSDSRLGQISIACRETNTSDPTSFALKMMASGYSGLWNSCELRSAYGPMDHFAREKLKAVRVGCRAEPTSN